MCVCVCDWVRRSKRLRKSKEDEVEVVIGGEEIEREGLLHVGSFTVRCPWRMPFCCSHIIHRNHLRNTALQERVS